MANDNIPYGMSCVLCGNTREDYFSTTCNWCKKRTHEMAYKKFCRQLTEDEAAQVFAEVRKEFLDIVLDTRQIEFCASVAEAIRNKFMEVNDLALKQR